MADAPRRFLRGSLTIARLPLGGGARVPLRVHWTMLLAIPWFAFAFLGRISSAQAGLPPATEWLLAVLLAVALFAGIALHELSHTAVGRPLGAEVREITLMFLGGVSQMSRGPRTPRGEILMAAAGPAASMLLAAASWAVSLPLAGHGLAGWMLSIFAQVNLTIGVFNLLPAYPLDGGRILRGSLALRLGARRATRVATVIGKGMAVVLAVVGVLIGAPILAVLAVFVFFGAEAESRAELMEQRLGDARVSEVMDPFVAAVPATASVDEAALHMRGGRRAVLVEEEGRVVGQVTAARLRAVPYPYRLQLAVASIMDEPPAPVGPDDTLSVAFHRMTDQQLEELPVVDHGHLAGVLRLSELARWAERRPA